MHEMPVVRALAQAGSLQAFKMTEPLVVTQLLDPRRFISLRSRSKFLTVSGVL